MMGDSLTIYDPPRSLADLLAREVLRLDAAELRELLAQVLEQGGFSDRLGEAWRLGVRKVVRLTGHPWRLVLVDLLDDAEGIRAMRAEGRS